MTTLILQSDGPSLSIRPRSNSNDDVPRLTGETVSTTHPRMGNETEQSIDTEPSETQTNDEHLDTSLDETSPTHATEPTTATTRTDNCIENFE